MIKILRVLVVHRLIRLFEENFLALHNAQANLFGIGVHINFAFSVCTECFAIRLVDNRRFFRPACRSENHRSGIHSHSLKLGIFFDIALRCECIVGIFRCAQQIPDTAIGRMSVIAAVVVNTDPHGHTNKTMIGFFIRLFGIGKRDVAVSIEVVAIVQTIIALDNHACFTARIKTVLIALNTTCIREIASELFFPEISVFTQIGKGCI